ncbi:hypothetical protein NE848_09080 [Gramella jeungdoensis]|uniref:Uncharacterized protein n=1 Tax=Gramella jeungdoensis TaxID=708091 RepID=A0ABT0Z324_9FLAO|nr:hypothetical protein [Gramella jeungdoensis]MCM8569532.1 hypothetical protein [Gramella jeungdoensis]
MRKVLVLILTLFVISCSEKNKFDGYYYQSNFKPNPYFMAPQIRVKDDSIISFYNHNKAVDSTIYAWNEEDSSYVSIESNDRNFGFLNSRFYAIGEDTLVQQFDTTGYAKKLEKFNFDSSQKISREEVQIEIYREILKNGYEKYSDTFVRTDKKSIVKKIEEQIVKDSIKNFHPFTSNSKVKTAVREYADFYLSDLGKLVENSIDIRRQADDLFHVKLLLENKYIGKRPLILELDFDKDTYSVKKIN